MTQSKFECCKSIAILKVEVRELKKKFNTGSKLAWILESSPSPKEATLPLNFDKFLQIVPF